jgi:hypothetical protein
MLRAPPRSCRSTIRLVAAMRLSYRQFLYGLAGWSVELRYAPLNSFGSATARGWRDEHQPASAGRTGYLPLVSAGTAASQEGG